MTRPVFLAVHKRLSQFPISCNIAINGSQYYNSDFVVFDVTSQEHSKTVRVIAPLLVVDTKIALISKPNPQLIVRNDLTGLKGREFALAVMNDFDLDVARCCIYDSMYLTRYTCV